MPQEPSILLTEATAQENQIELIRRGRYNAFDGERVATSLLGHRQLWRAVLMDRFCFFQRYDVFSMKGKPMSGKAMMIDLHPDTQQPYCFLSLNFDKSYPVVIWGLRLLMDAERFDVPQSDLHNISLAEAFSWAYAHFVLEDQPPLHQPRNGTGAPSLTTQVLQYAAATA